MNVLAFDTCFGACSAAVLWRAARPVNAPQLIGRYEEMATGQAERLVPMIEEALRESGQSLTELDAIAVTEGPGTFTGIRVSVAAARGFSLATGLPIRATTSLHVMARRALADLKDGLRADVLAVCVDARAGRTFVQLFDSGSADPVTPADMMTPEAAADLCPDATLLCVGSAGHAVAEAALGIGRTASAALPTLQPDARHLAHLAESLPVRDPIVPLYLRPPDAKPQTGQSLPRA